MLFHRRHKLWSFRIGEARNVFDGEGLFHLTAKIFGDQTRFNPFARAVNRRRGAGRASSDNEEVVKGLILQRRTLFFARHFIEYGI